MSAQADGPSGEEEVRPGPSGHVSDDLPLKKGPVHAGDRCDSLALLEAPILWLPVTTASPGSWSGWWKIPGSAGWRGLSGGGCGGAAGRGLQDHRGASAARKKPLTTARECDTIPKVMKRRSGGPAPHLQRRAKRFLKHIFLRQTWGVFFAGAIVHPRFILEVFHIGKLEQSAQ